MNIGFTVARENDFGNGVVKWTEIQIRAPFMPRFIGTVRAVKEKKTDGSPDFVIWWSHNVKGEKYENVRAGSLWLKETEGGVKYLNGYIESPIFSIGRMSIALFAYVPKEGMPVQNIRHNVVWSPERRRDEENSHMPSGYEASTPAANIAPAPSENIGTTSNGAPIVLDDSDEIPF